MLKKETGLVYVSKKSPLCSLIFFPQLILNLALDLLSLSWGKTTTCMRVFLHSVALQIFEARELRFMLRTRPMVSGFLNFSVKIGESQNNWLESTCWGLLTNILLNGQAQEFRLKICSAKYWKTCFHDIFNFKGKLRPIILVIPHSLYKFIRATTQIYLVWITHQ